jgi:hypothetical protein
MDALQSVRHPRFLQLQKAVSFRIGSRRGRNHLLDALHIWTAEVDRATHFLTCDYRLLRSLESRPSLRPTVVAIAPSDLVRQLAKSRLVGSKDMLRFGWGLLARRFNAPAPISGLEDLVSMGNRLERQGYFDH